MSAPHPRAQAEVDPSIVDEHADEAAFLWEARDRAAEADGHDAASLAELDERVEAHLDGLRVAGRAGREAVAARRLRDPGDVFVAGLLAAEAHDLGAVAAILEAVVERPSARALVGALAWADARAAMEVIEPLLAARPAALQALGLRACGARRFDPGAPLARALAADDPALAAAGLRAAGRLGRVDLRDAVAARLGDPSCRREAAHAGALLGVRAAGAALWELAEQGGEGAEAAALAAVAVTEPRAAADRLAAWAAGARARLAIVAAGALGDPASVPWVLARMAEPALARRAAQAFAAISGAAIAGALRAGPPAGSWFGPSDDPDDDDVAPDPDSALPWPALEAVRACWSAQAGGLEPGRRYLLGRPHSAAALSALCEHGSQRQRAFAARELACLRPAAPLIETRARPLPR